MFRTKVQTEIDEAIKKLKLVREMTDKHDQWKQGIGLICDNVETLKKYMQTT